MTKTNFLTCIFISFLSFVLGQSPVFVDVTTISDIQDITKIAQPFGYGASLADFDNDGDVDFFLATDSEIPNRLYRNNGNGEFQDIATSVGLGSLAPSNASLWFDYNGDHLLDIITIGNCLEPSCLTKIEVHLYQQTSAGNFIETTDTSGISINDKYNSEIVNPIITTGGVSAGDINNDGYLDLLITIWKGKNSFFLNNGDGTFSDISDSSGLGLANNDNWQAVFHDFNKDGLLDIYINVDFAPNELWINKNNNIFDEIASSSGTDSSFNEMGIALGDYDNDSDLDIYATNITVDGKHNIFLENTTLNSSPSFIEISKSLGVSDNGWDWGTTFFDANNDGWLDLAATNGYILHPIDNSKLWINNNGESFTDASNSTNFNDNLSATSLMAFDMDRDGDLDLLQTLKENTNTNKPALLYKNSLKDSPNSGNYLTIKPRMLGSNHFAIGAIVKIKSGALNSMRLITAGTSFYGQEPAEAFFGIGENTIVEEIKVEWPDNTFTILSNVEVNQVLTITNETIADEINGCTDPNSCNYDPLATIDDGTCAYSSTSEILGPTESAFNEIEMYSYNSNDNNPLLTWTVTGGELLDGQGSSNISVKWGLNGFGEISISEQIMNCSDSIKNLNITLNLENREQNISVARIWNEALLAAIRNDFARPTVHARNLFHSAIAIYDIWAVYNGTSTYLLDKEIHGFSNTLAVFSPKDDIDIALNKSISYAMYRLLSHRFQNSPNASESLSLFKLIMEQMDYDINITSTNYESGEAAAFGNYVAQIIIDYGLTDNSRETTGYDNAFYEPKNPSLDLNNSGNTTTGIIDPNRWQPLTFTTFVDQSGNSISENTPSFLSPEWGNVSPFALSAGEKEIFTRDGNNFAVYKNPATPPLLNSANLASRNEYQWNFSLVSLWSSHLDPTDGVMWDISPKSNGNIDIQLFPKDFNSYQNFYDDINGGDPSLGRTINPKTGQAYVEQIVPRGDYTRVLAEFWADGPDSETPPGHWFTILNYVSDHPDFTKKFNGQGNELNTLEWDVKSYFILGGAMHDAAITTWGIKGWHDYIRPISAIRYMSELGQSSDMTLPNYHPEGIELKEGYIELIDTEDLLSGDNNEHVGKIKLYSWLGHDSINNPDTDTAGVGWILAENWWPYQRPSFVTPPFAGYVSGHSTFSRAAAEVITLVTGDAYFPGGLGEFIAKKDVFLKFEKGPSVDIKLQWATYRDASDQTSLSRIWGGIHPPIDDIPGRFIGEEIGIEAYNFALPYFAENQSSFIVPDSKSSESFFYPNPVENILFISSLDEDSSISIFSLSGQLIMNGTITKEILEYDVSKLPTGIYSILVKNRIETFNELIIKR